METVQRIDESKKLLQVFAIFFNGSSIIQFGTMRSLPATFLRVLIKLFFRVLAQLVARDVRDVEVAGSNPVYPILNHPIYVGWLFFLYILTGFET